MKIDSYLEQVNIYNEGLYLLSEYTIGFEIEGVVDIDEYDDIVSIAENFIYKLRNDKTVEIPTYGRDETKFLVGTDLSIEVDDEEEQKGFEFRSPVFKLTPNNIKQIANFIDEMMNYFYINESCGFHVHIGYPEQTRKDFDSFWVLCVLAAENLKSVYNKKLKRFIKHKNFNFENYQQQEYAPTKQIENIRYVFFNYSTKSRILRHISEKFKDNKYQYFRIHPQGTLEWRGPRQFLKNDKAKKIIIDFFFDMLIPFIKFVNDALEKDEIDTDHGFVITKKELYNKIKTTRKKILKDNKNFEFNTNVMTAEVINEVMYKFQWLKKCKFKNAIAKVENNHLLWLNGTWEDGIWEDTNGIWDQGLWLNGIFKGDIMRNCDWKNGKFLGNTFETGEWHDGFFKGKIFKDSDWFGGLFTQGIFDEDSEWDDGIFRNGTFKGLWINGFFKGGDFKGSYAQDNEE